MGANESSDKFKGKIPDSQNDLNQNSSTTISKTSSTDEYDDKPLNLVGNESNRPNINTVSNSDSEINSKVSKENMSPLPSLPSSSPPLTPSSTFGTGKNARPPAYPSEKRQSSPKLTKKKSAIPPPIPDDSSDDELPPIPESGPYVFSNSKSSSIRTSMKGKLSERFSGLGDELKNANLSLGSNIHLRQSRASFSHDIIVDAAFNTLVNSDSNTLAKSGSSNNGSNNNMNNSSNNNNNQSRSPELSKNMSSSNFDNVDNTIFYRDRNQSFSLAIGSYIKPVPIKPLAIEERQPEYDFYVKYKLGRQIGQGSFACVYEGLEVASMAIKVVTKQPKLNVSMLKREVNLTSSLHHPNIVSCLGFYEDKQYFYIINELMEGGELLNRINQFRVYDEESAKIALISITKAILYCHKQGIAHRDLKPENILLATVNDDASIKITDFGLARLMGGSHSITVCGTPEYIAPEVIEQRPYDTQVDMWSLGVIAYILLSGTLPFPDVNNRSVLFYKITHGQYSLNTKYWSGVSGQAKEFVELLLQVDPNNRLTAELAINHPFLVSSKYYTVMTAQELFISRFNNIRDSWKAGISGGFKEEKLALGKVLDLYTYVNMLGYGPYGYAYVAEQNQAKKKVAIKVISKYSVAEPAKFLSEVKQLLSINHTGIIKVIQIEEMGDTIDVVTNYQVGGNILDGLTKKNSYSEYDVRMIIWSILTPLSYIHSFGVCHRNIKPENILLSDTRNVYDLELSDFGMVPCIDDNIFVNSPSSFVEFISPEIIKDEEITVNSDSWSIGVLTYLLICGKHPFQSDNTLEMVSRIGIAEFSFDDALWENVSEDAKQFISSLLKADPNERMSCTDAISHSFIQGTREDVDLQLTITSLRYYYENRKVELNNYYNQYYN